MHGGLGVGGGPTIGTNKKNRCSNELLATKFHGTEVSRKIIMMSNQWMW